MLILDRTQSLTFAADSNGVMEIVADDLDLAAPDEAAAGSRQSS